MLTEKMRDMHIECRENDSNEKWLIDGKIVPIDRKPIIWEKNAKPMYTIKEKQLWQRKKH